MNNIDGFKSFLLSKQNNEDWTRAKIAINILYIVVGLIGITLYNPTRNLELIALILVINCIFLVIEINKKLEKKFYLLRFFCLMVLLNFCYVNFINSIIISLLTVPLYIFERRRELTYLYNKEYSVYRPNNNKAFAIMVGSITLLVLRYLDPSYTSPIAFYLLILSYNVFFTFEYNLTDNPYDPTYVELVKVDEYILNRD